MFPEGWYCLSVFFEAEWEGLTCSLWSKGGLPESRQDWDVCTEMEAYFTQLGRACSGVTGLWGSSRQLTVLGTCSTGVIHPLMVGADSWVSKNSRGSSPEQPDLGGPPQNRGRSCTARPNLFSLFWAAVGSCSRLAVLGRCSTGVQHPSRVGAAGWATKNPKDSSPGQLNWQDHLRMEADFAWPGQACSSFSGLQGALAVGWQCWAAIPQECSTL